ncbi:MAG: ArsR family transcriptional regulator [Planctomycetes bacterium]|nr:ArsR family transcriptional regulator [Planctomycetota bacterium]
MDEVIVRVCRTIACLARLCIMSFLAGCREATPTDIGRKVPMSLDKVSAHLRRLATDGLIKRRRSGTWCYCSAQSPYSEQALSGQVASWIYRMLEDPVATMRRFGVGQLRNASRGEAQKQLHKLIFEAATAFTDLRRLQILRRLCGGDVLTPHSMTKELHMSKAAVSRHTDKLIRRGYLKASSSRVEPSLAGQGLSYQLATEFKTPIHAALFKIVSAHWKQP